MREITNTELRKIDAIANKAAKLAYNRVSTDLMSWIHQNRQDNPITKDEMLVVHKNTLIRYNMIKVIPKDEKSIEVIKSLGFGYTEVDDDF